MNSDRGREGKLMAGKWCRLAGWDIGRDRLKDFAPNLEGERERRVQRVTDSMIDGRSE